SVETAPGIDETMLLRVATSLEHVSEHPLAASIVAGARSLGVAPVAVEHFVSVTGRGVSGRVEGRLVAVGSMAYLESLHVNVAELGRQAEPHYRDGQTVVFVAIDGRPAGLLAVADSITPSAREAVDALRADGITVVMLTGDRRATADAVARAAGIDRVEAEVLPAQKAEVVQRLQAEGQLVAMAGDAINDAPAFAKADAGIALGTGTDIAMESAAIT